MAMVRSRGRAPRGTRCAAVAMRLLALEEDGEGQPQLQLQLQSPPSAALSSHARRSRCLGCMWGGVAAVLRRRHMAPSITITMPLSLQGVPAGNACG